MFLLSACASQDVPEVYNEVNGCERFDNTYICPDNIMYNNSFVHSVELIPMCGTNLHALKFGRDILAYDINDSAFYLDPYTIYEVVNTNCRFSVDNGQIIMLQY